MILQPDAGLLETLFALLMAVFGGTGNESDMAAPDRPRIPIESLCTLFVLSSQYVLFGDLVLSYLGHSPFEIRTLAWKAPKQRQSVGGECHGQ
jgi:hypothetical protein